MARPLARLAAVTAAAAGLLAVAAPVMAQSYDPYGGGYGYAQDHRAPVSYCDSDRRQRQAAGATFGAAIGAVAGSQIAARGRRTEGSLLGGVVGAFLGAGVGSSSQSPACTGHDQGYGQQGYGDGRARDDRHAYDDRYGRDYGGYGYDDRYSDDRSSDDRRGGYGRDPYARDDDGYSVADCRVVRIRERDAWGRTVTRSERVCSGR